jgi:uncharacterized tellurite resistance protein B-like protein
MQDSLQQITPEHADSIYNYVADSLRVVYLDNQLASELEAPPESGISWTQIVTILLALGIPAYFFFMVWWNGRYWDRGIFPPLLRFRRSNYYEAVISLATNILRCDADQRPEKLTVLRRFIAKKFPDVDEHVLNSVTNSANQPVTASSVARWIKKHVASEQEKTEILQLLFDMALTDGALGQKEYAILEAYTKNAGIDPSQLERLTPMFNP